MDILCKFCFSFAVPTKGSSTINPRTRRRLRKVSAPESFLRSTLLLVIGTQQMGKIGVVNATTVEVIRGRPLEGICRCLVDKGSQKFALVIGKNHRWLIPRVSLRVSVGLLDFFICEVFRILLSSTRLVQIIGKVTR